MSHEHVRQLIDKLLIEPLSSEENIFLLNKLEEHPELMDYYHETLKLKNELSSLHETEAFEKKDLLNAREEFFSSIEKETKQYTFLKYAAAVLIGAFISYTTTYLTVSEPIEYVSSLDVQQLDNNNIILTGQRISEFEMKGSMSDKKIQNLLINFVRTNSNAGHKYTAMDALAKIKEDRSELIDTYIQLANDDPNLGLRLKAIQNLSYYIDIKKVQTALISLLKSESNDVVRNAVFDVLNTIHGDQMEQLERSIGSFESPYIKQANIKQRK